MNIDKALVKKLVTAQFPQWSELPIKMVKESGWDNRTFHLGENMTVRIPSQKDYASQILKESKWLPILGKSLNYKITKPLALGIPSKDYPEHWAINEWIEGETASLSTITNLNQFAKDLADFLMEFQSIDALSGPPAGKHNFYRGGNLSVYSADIDTALPKIENEDEKLLVQSLWQSALSSHWEKPPVWVHGDFAANNLLVKKGSLHAVIDFGCLAVGDPACDLAIAWYLLDKPSRETFREALSIDNNTWLRGMGWTLWKTLCWPIAGTPVNQVLQSLYNDFKSLHCNEG